MTASIQPADCRVTTVALPDSGLLAGALGRVDWSDAYAVPVPDAGARDPQQWADAVFRAPPRWARVLFGIREALVPLVGIERGGGHVFDTLASNEEEVLLGTDQGHLSFRASVLLEPDRVILSTVVEVHNRRGRAYSALIRRVHPVVVRSGLARAARGTAAAT
jgi:hypothetical protein